MMTLTLHLFALKLLCNKDVCNPKTILIPNPIRPLCPILAIPLLSKQEVIAIDNNCQYMDIAESPTIIV